MTRGEMALGAKHLGYWGETTRVENRGETTRGETTRGGNVLGAKRLVTETIDGQDSSPTPRFLIFASGVFRRVWMGYND